MYIDKIVSKETKINTITGDTIPCEKFGDVKCKYTIVGITVDGMVAVVDNGSYAKFKELPIISLYDAEKYYFIKDGNKIDLKGIC